MTTSEQSTCALAARILGSGDAEWAEVEEVCRALLAQSETTIFLAGHIARQNASGVFTYPHADFAHCSVCQAATEIVLGIA